MKELKDQYEFLGLKNVKTYIQSGNVVFDYSHTNFLTLPARIQDRIKKKFEVDTPVIMRSKVEMEKVIKNNPFKDGDEEFMHVTFLTEKPASVDLSVFEKFKESSEKFMIIGKEVYLYLPKGYGRTKLNNNLFENKLKVSATTRNYRTVNALLSMA